MRVRDWVRVRVRVRNEKKNPLLYYILDFPVMNFLMWIYSIGHYSFCVLFFDMKVKMRTLND